MNYKLLARYLSCGLYGGLLANLIISGHGSRKVLAVLVYSVLLALLLLYWALQDRKVMLRERSRT